MSVAPSETRTFGRGMNSSQANSALILSVLFYFVNPVFGIITGLIALISYPKGRYIDHTIIFFMISFFFSMLNTTRVPESDLLGYKVIFESASRLSFADYMYGYNQEIVFYAANYALNVLLFGNFQLYIVTVTLFQYMLRFRAIQLIVGNDDNTTMIIACIFVLLDSTSFFSSVHLLRQMTSTSLFFYFFAMRYAKQRTLWWLIPISVLIHSSSGLLYALALVPSLNKRVSTKLMVSIAIITFAIAFLGQSMLAFVDGITQPISWLNYPFDRLQSVDTLSVGWFEGNQSSTAIINLLRFVIAPITLFYFLYHDKISMNYTVNFLLLFFALSIFLYSANLHFLLMRMSYSIYPLGAVAMALMIRGLRDKIGTYFSTTICCFMILYMCFRFARSFLYTDFNLLSLEEALVRPFVFYLIEL